MNADNKESFAQLMEQFYRVINKFNKVEKMPYDFGISETLHPSEIHMIQAIGKRNEINVTTLAKVLGITKGAVSQMVAKLNKRRLVNKVKSVDNDKEVLLILTAKGQRAYDGHEKFHQDMYREFIEYMNEIPPEQVRVFRNVLDKVDYYIDQYWI